MNTWSIRACLENRSTGFQPVLWLSDARPTGWKPVLRLTARGVFKHALTKCCGLVLAAVALTMPAVRADEPAWIMLFDGKSLDGWVLNIEPCRPDTRSEAEKASEPVPPWLLPEEKRGKARFYVEDGAIVGHAEKNSIHAYLCTEKEYGDFELECEFFVGWPATKTAGMNSGIQIRSKWNPDLSTHRMNGLQVDIDGGSGGWAGSGEFFLEGGKIGALGKFMPDSKKPKSNAAFKANEWNKMRILAQGARIQTWVNGQPVGDMTVRELADAQPRGFIGLQVHEILDPKPAEIRWRNLRLRELPAAP